MNTFESEMKKSEFFLHGESEEKSLANIRSRIAEVEMNPSKISIPKFLMIAASLAIIFSAGYFLLIPGDSLNFKQIATQNFEHYPNYQNLTVRGESDGTDLLLAYQAYDKMDYHRASNIFESAQSSLSDVDNLYYGISLIGTKDYVNANMVIIRINESNLGEYKFAHTFYLALSSLAEGEKESAISKFEELAKGNSQFSEKASEILKSISSGKSMLPDK